MLFPTRGPIIQSLKKELRSNEEDQNITLDFSSRAGKKYEFRVWANGNGSLSVKENYS